MRYAIFFEFELEEAGLSGEEAPGVSILCLSQDEAGTPRVNDSYLEIVVEMGSLIGSDLF